jgi:hypothetical protein
MNAEQVRTLLHDLDACSEAYRWSQGKDLHQIWTTCERGDWLLWLAGHMIGRRGWHSRQQVVLAACACAETALKFVKPGEDRPRQTIETARAWVRGEASIEDVRRAAAAAYAAAAADAAAYADAAATDAATDAAAYAAAAAAAAAYAAYAAYADADAAAAEKRASIRDQVLGQVAEIVVQILIDMKCEGCQWLALTEAA